MSQSAAELVVILILAYLSVGLAFALLFAARWAGLLDPVARSGTMGFRLLILPGATLLWPWLAVRLRRATARGPA
jgi:hypothetical protein